MKEKILYHGTNERFSIIDTNLCSGYKDFGKGFYTTPRKEQAISWAKKRKNNKKSYKNISNKKSSSNGYVYAYSFDIDSAVKAGVKFLEFKSANIDWLKFIIENRLLDMHLHDYDVVIGPIADAEAYSLINDFYEDFGYIKNVELLDDLAKQEYYMALNKLLYDLHPENLYTQYFFAHKKNGKNLAFKYLKRNVKYDEVI